jgi:hypothetical protein
MNRTIGQQNISMGNCKRKEIILKVKLSGAAD